VLLIAFAGISQYRVVAWGKNDFGQLGNGNTIDVATPQQLNNGNFARIAAGHYHLVAIQPDGTLWTWGQNSSSQLGDGTTTDRNLPARISNEQWLAAAAGWAHSAAIRQDGSLWTWGRNTSYQLGDGTYVGFRDIPTRISNGAGNKWVNIAAGMYHNAAIRE